MADCHVVAYVQADRTVTMHRSGSHPGFANTVHHAVMPATEELTVIVWWRERLSPSEEHRHNAAAVETIKEDFARRR